VTPDVFLEMAGGILHSLSYQQVWLSRALPRILDIPVHLLLVVS
jgi:hypothetical protein